jgi:hypothetical protein
MSKIRYVELLVFELRTEPPGQQMFITGRWLLTTYKFADSYQSDSIAQ